MTRVNVTSWNVVYYYPSFPLLSIYLSSFYFFYCLSCCTSSYSIFIICISISSLSLMFLEFLCLSSFSPFDPSVKSPLGHPSWSPCCCGYGFAAQWRWPLTSQALTSVFMSFFSLSFSLISPHSLTAFHLWASVPARVNHRDRSEGNK